MLPLKDNADWIKDPFPMMIENDFATYAEVLKYVIEADIDEPAMAGMGDDVPAEYLGYDDGAARRAITIPETEGGQMPYEYTQFSCRDTTIGGSDVLNPLPQFCEFDDIQHPLTSVGRMNPDSIFQPTGMGRVYAETIDQNQQILWISVGIPEFNDLISYYKSAFDSSIASFAHTGEARLGRLIGRLAGLTISIPLMPFTFVNDVLSTLENTKITKYYQFKPTMLSYYKTVNTLLVQLAVSMDLYPQNDDDGEFTDSGDPELVRLATPVDFRDGFSIFKLLNKKMYRLNREADNGEDYEDLIERLNKENSIEDEKSVFDEWKAGFLGSSRAVHQFVGIRIEKTTESSESLSNQTGTSSVASTLNQKAKSFSDSKFGMAGGKTGFGAFDSMVQAASDVASGLTEALAVDGIASAVKGTGYFDIPDRWIDSSFTKSYSFSMKLYPSSGSKYAIFQSLYYPYLSTMGFAFPRSTGENSYTSPNVISIYSKGKFACPLGIVDSYTVKRGRPEHGWTGERLPLCLDIQFTVKDLSPTMFLSVGGDGLLGDNSPISVLLGKNANTTMYLNTLSGLGLADIHYTMRQLKRRWSSAWKLLSSQTFNSASMGMWLGELPLCKAVGSFSNSRLSTR